MKKETNSNKNHFFVDILCRENDINLYDEQIKRALRGFVFGRYSLQQTFEDRKFNALNKESIMERLEFIYNANEINNTPKKELTKEEIKKEARSIFLYMILSKKPIDKISSMTNPEAYVLLKNSCSEYKTGLDAFKEGLLQGKTIDKIRKELNQVTQRDNGEMSEEKNELEPEQEPEQEKDTMKNGLSEKDTAIVTMERIYSEISDKAARIKALLKTRKEYEERLRQKEEDAKTYLQMAREDAERANQALQEANRRKDEADEELKKQEKNLKDIQAEREKRAREEQELRELFRGWDFSD